MDIDKSVEQRLKEVEAFMAGFESPNEVQTFSHPNEEFGFYPGNSPDYVGFADYLRDKYKLCSHDSYSIIYNGKHYETITRLGLHQLILKHTNRLVKATHIEQFVKIALAESYKKESSLKNIEGLININNGILDVMTQKIMPHSSQYKFRYCLKHDYKPDDKCPEFIDYLNDVFKGDQEQIKVTSQIYGYCLMGGNPFLHKAFVLYGTGRNGKGVWLDILKALIGKSNYSAVPISMLDKPFSVVSLDGKLANIVGETPNDTVNAEAFKTATSGEPLRAAQKGLPEFDLEIDCRFIFAANKMPRFSELTTGLLERLFFINFPKYVKIKDRDFGLSRRIIKNEITGVLNFALNGLKQLMTDKYIIDTTAHKEVFAEFKKGADSVYEWFVSDVDIGGTVATQYNNEEIYDKYRKYVKTSGGMPVKKTNFEKQFIKHLKESIDDEETFEALRWRGNTERGFKNIFIKEKLRLF